MSNVLSQMQGRHERVIAYVGKRLALAEKYYNTTEKVALVVTERLKHFDQYTVVTIVTDQVLS